MNRLIASALLLGLSVSAVVAAEPITIRTGTAGELAEACAANPKEPGADARINFCHGFAQGAIATRLRTGGDKKLFCFPSPAPKRTETMGDFVRWVRAEQGRTGLNSVDGLFQFLAQRYPCP